MPPTLPLRTLLLFDPDAQPQCWNERMQPGGYAVLYSSNQLAGSPHPSREPFCTVWSTLAEAEQHATEQVARLPTLRCRIYDHHGLAHEPLRELRGLEHHGESEIPARFRRWGGALFFLAGVVLIAFDWSADFRRSWPATLGVRLLPVGMILLLPELVVVFEARRKRSRLTRAK
jgi:hypothetical protein